MPDNFDGRFRSIEGNVPNLYEKVEGCPYYKRCKIASEECLKKEPEMVEINKGHKVKCLKAKDLVREEVKNG